MKFRKITIGLCALVCFASLAAGCKDRSETPPSDEGSYPVYSVSMGEIYNSAPVESTSPDDFWANSSSGNSEGGATSSSSSSTSSRKPVQSSSAHVHNHKVIDTLKPTCVEKGWNEMACECGDRYYAELAATGHKYTQTTVEASCENYGCTHFVCSVCGDNYDKDVKNALGHTWGEWETVKEATASAAGEKQSICSRCNKTRSETIPKLENSVSYDDFTSEVVRLVNIERANNGLSALSENSTLGDYAQLRSKEIVSKFEHYRPDGASALDYLHDLGTLRTYGENIAMGQQTPEAVVNAWMNSDGHRKNILKEDFTMIGVGCYKSGGAYYWVQIFGG